MADFQGVGHPFGPNQVCADDRGDQAKAAVIGQGQGLLLRGEALAAQHRAKNLFGPQATACRHIRIYSRAYKPARLLRGGTAGEAVQAFGTGDGEILHHFGPLRLAGQRPHVDFFGRGVAHAQFFNGDGQALQQRIGDAVVHQQPRSGRTHLPGVPAKTGDDPFNRLVEVAIVEHHDCRLATQLQGDRPTLRRGAAHDLAAHGVAAGK
ncbi:hypothetical protein D9M71_51210 [compost metagenome]